MKKEVQLAEVRCTACNFAIAFMGKHTDLANEKDVRKVFKKEHKTKTKCKTMKVEVR